MPFRSIKPVTAKYVSKPAVRYETSKKFFFLIRLQELFLDTFLGKLSLFVNT